MSDYEWIKKDPQFLEWMRGRHDTKGFESKFSQDADGKWSGEVTSQFANVQVSGYETREAAEAAISEKFRILMNELEGQ